jgi:putative endonuclease
VKLNNSVYILASKRNGTLYIGVTSNLVKRIWEHKQNFAEGFTSRYGVHVLVYFEMHDDIAEAIRREKQLKKWKRSWKIELREVQSRMEGFMAGYPVKESRNAITA